MKQIGSKKQQKTYRHKTLIALVIFLAVANFALLLRFFMSGRNIALFNPKGQIAQGQYDLMMYVVTVLFAVVVPTLFLTYFIAWKYRESNTKPVHVTNHRRSKLHVAYMWIVPIIVLVILASVMIPATHRLAPQKSIAADAKPITIQVIALRWKWLFIYPEQGIATVNFVNLPINTPVEFKLTADETPMSSFWIPNLGGQLYAMTGHVNTLNLIADVVGEYPGKTAELNGKGFAGMKFIASASEISDFDKWVQEVKNSPYALDSFTYKNLLKPSEYNEMVLYSSYDINIYDEVVMKYRTSDEGHEHVESTKLDTHNQSTEGHKGH